MNTPKQGPRSSVHRDWAVLLAMASWGGKCRGSDIYSEHATLARARGGAGATYSLSTIYSALPSLLERGLVERHPDGRWSITEAGLDWSPRVARGGG